MKAQNIIEKIWANHIVQTQESDPLIPHILAIDFMLIHEVTSAQAFDTLRDKKIKPFDCGRLLATLDHSIPTRKNRFEIYDQAARKQVETLRANCKEFSIPIYDFESGNQGIVHVIGPELGITQPGMTIVCGDSHTSTHGAFGALAFGVGTSEVSHVLATGCILQSKPKTMSVRFNGKLKSGVFAKDAIMRLIAEIGIGGATGYVIEYSGDAISLMGMDERMTICNMSIECGARAGLIAPDEVTYKFLKGLKFSPRDKDWDKAIAYWNSLKSDYDACFDRVIEIDLNQLSPMITWGTNPGQAIALNQNLPDLKRVPLEQRSAIEQALNYVGLKGGSPIIGTPIDWAFVGSCTNGRIEDLRLVAKVLDGNKIDRNVTMYIVPGSESVRAQAINEGLDKIFLASGADFRMPGCSMCLGMNDDLVPAGKRCISSSNRNFVGRQGPGSITHLASPVTVAASALAGRIVSGEDRIKG